MIDINNMNKIDKIKLVQLNGLYTLCKYFDYDRGATAKALGVDVAVLYNWFSRGRISAKKAIEAERVTNGAVTKQMLRPDVDLWMNEG